MSPLLGSNYAPFPTVIILLRSFFEPHRKVCVIPGSRCDQERVTNLLQVSNHQSEPLPLPSKGHKLKRNLFFPLSHLQRHHASRWLYEEPLPVRRPCKWTRSHPRRA